VTGARRSRGAPSGETGLWRELTEEIIACERCPRLRSYCRSIAATKRRAYRDWTYHGRPVPGFGDPAAHLLLLGLAPGAHGANRTGRMFTGDASGTFLFAALHRRGLASAPDSVSAGDGLALRGVYITAVARCAPPDNRPTREEIGACREYLARELDLLHGLRAILALGGIAWDAVRELARERFAVQEAPPRFAHGLRWRPAGRAPAFLAAYHPSRQNTQTGRLTPAMYDEVLAAAWAEASKDGPAGDSRLPQRPGSLESPAGR
jgi:uracil-DNA glycosylase family 4